MTYPKMKPCPKCGNTDMSMFGYGDWGPPFGYGDWGPPTWHVECENCMYMGPGGNKLQAIREHNQLVAEATA